MSGYFNLGKLVGKKALETIKGVKPGTKTGAESVASWKSKASKSKLKMAKDALEQTFKKTDTELKKLTETTKKNRKSLRNYLLNK